MSNDRLEPPRIGRFTIVLDIDYFGPDWETEAVHDALMALPDVVEVEGPMIDGALGVSFEMLHMDRDNIVQYVDDATRAVLHTSVEYRTRRSDQETEDGSV